MLTEWQFGLRQSARRQTESNSPWAGLFYCLRTIFILWTNTICQSLSNSVPVCFSMRHKSHSATCASPPQSLLHPQNAINVQPSFILIHSPLAQMKWIRNLVGQGRACRLPSVAELFSILLASREREGENERARKRPNDEEKWSGMQIAGCHVQWGGLVELVTVETQDRVNEAEGETEFKKTAAVAEERRKNCLKKLSLIYLPNQSQMSGLWLA